MTAPERDPEDVRDERDSYDDVPAEAPIEAAEADAAEQARSLTVTTSGTPDVGIEVNEYDAVEQSRAVDGEDEYRS